MGTLLVVLLSLVVGAITYAATLRNGRRVPAALGFEPSSHTFAMSATAATEPVPDPLDADEGTDADVVDLGAVREGDLAPLPAAPEAFPVAVAAQDASLETEPGYTYLRVATRGPSWRDRIAGIAGIVVILVVGAAVLAFGVYQAGHAVNAIVQKFLNG